MSSQYVVRMTYPGVIAMVDIALEEVNDDSPRWDGRVVLALERNELVALPQVRDAKKRETREQRLARFERARLTKKGHAYLEAAKYEYKSAEAFLEALAA